MDHTGPSSSWLASATNFWSVAPALAVNVFNSGRRRAAPQQAQATAQYRDTVLAAFREVEDQLAALRQRSR